MKKVITTRDIAVSKILADFHDPRRHISLGLKRPFFSVIKDGAWTGQRCFILGGGPSLRGFDFERLRGERVIAVNRAFVDAEFADIMFFMDHSFYKWIREGNFGQETRKKYFSFKGYKVFLDIMLRNFPDVFGLAKIDEVGVATSLKRGIFHGNNSGFGALNVAVCLGANPIYLLGFDMRHVKDNGKMRSHYHDGYPSRQPAGVLENFKNNFAKIASTLRSKKIKVVNLCPNSAMTCFPRKSIDEVIQ